MQGEHRSIPLSSDVPALSAEYLPNHPRSTLCASQPRIVLYDDQCTQNTKDDLRTLIVILGNPILTVHAEHAHVSHDPVGDAGEAL